MTFQITARAGKSTQVDRLPPPIGNDMRIEHDVSLGAGQPAGGRKMSEEWTEELSFGSPLKGKGVPVVTNENFVRGRFDADTDMTDVVER